MKYLVNRQTKEHKVATPLAESIIKGYPDFKDDWQLVEADSEGWIPWSGGECPLPENALVCICVVGHRYRGSSPAANYNWGARAGIEYYRPILAEQEPDNHLSEEATRAINETFRRRTDEARLATEHLTHCRNKGCFNDAVGGVYCTEHGPAQAEGTPSVFDRLKSAVAASESIPGIIAEIDAMLPDGYCVTRCVEQPAEDMTDWTNWRDGDLIECVNDEGWETFHVGGIYKFTRWGKGGGFDADVTEVADQFVADFRFHSRPAKESV